MKKIIFIEDQNCSWLQNGYKNFENTEKSNIFRKSDDKKERKYVICHLRLFQPNP